MSNLNISTEMVLKQYLPSRLFEMVEKAGLKTARQILLMSESDFVNIVNLNEEEIKIVKDAAARSILGDNPFSDALQEKLKSAPRISTGCSVLDVELLGGFRRGTLSEVAGESGSGKTQLCLQAAARSWQQGAVYICTEDAFPSKRLQQMLVTVAEEHRGGSSELDPKRFGDNIFVEHVYDVVELKKCVQVRLPRLLETKNDVSLVVVDSIAAPFRGCYDSSMLMVRAKDLKEVGFSLLKTAKNHNVAVVCINQVSAVATEGTSTELVPCLGLVWSSMISTRFLMGKTARKRERAEDGKQLRSFVVKFAPDLPSDKVLKMVIDSRGIKCVG